MEIRLLLPADAEAFQAVRLLALRDCPTAFSSSYEEERDRPLSFVAERIAPAPGHAVFGAFEAEALVGIVGIHREDHVKLAHKAFIWGMYVAPRYRGRGVGRKLLDRALMQAASMPGLRQVKLGVNATNSAATALYEAVGFERVGIERDFLQVEGVFHDEIQMEVRVDAQILKSPPARQPP
jgi:ribosomal protein S18 acetylase RimI-like enzyme